MFSQSKERHYFLKGHHMDQRSKVGSIHSDVASAKIEKLVYINTTVALWQQQLVSMYSRDNELFSTCARHVVVFLVS